MGLTMRAVGTSPPYEVVITVSCDGNHGFLLVSQQFITPDDGHPRDPAMRAGWKFTPDGPVYCPSCARAK